MFKNIRLLIVFLVILSLSARAQNYTSFFLGNNTDAQTIPLGGVCLMGGATESDDAIKWFLQRSGGGDVLVLRATGGSGYNSYFYSQLGITINSVETIVFNNAAAAQETYILDKIKNAEAIWFAGGDQWSYVNYWRNSGVGQLINKQIREKNIVVGGTSAGMAILGQFYFSAQNGSVTSAAALQNSYNSTMTVDSTSFLKIKYLDNVITDTHYDNPNRKGRQVAFLARAVTDWNAKAKGIACDEYTAVCIDTAGLARIFGGFPTYDDNAYFIQTNCALNTILPETCQPNTPLTWNRNAAALKVYQVKGTTQGSNTFNVKTWLSGNGGVWQNWSVNGGVLSEISADSIACNPVLSLRNNLTDNVKIFPNPAQNKLTIVLNKKAMSTQIIIQNYLGKVLINKQFNDLNNVDMDIAHLAKGLYIVCVISDDKYFTQKIIKE